MFLRFLKINMGCLKLGPFSALAHLEKQLGRNTKMYTKMLQWGKAGAA